MLVGSGAGALTAALRAHDNDLSVLMIDKSDVYSGTTAVPGGGVWIPRNSRIALRGGSDSHEEAITYLRDVVGKEFDQTHIDAYLATAHRR